MIEEEEASMLIGISKELEDALSTTVRINHGQVLNIIVADLLSKYKSAESRGADYSAKMLKDVLLQYYLTPYELETLLST